MQRQPHDPSAVPADEEADPMQPAVDVIERWLRAMSQQAAEAQKADLQKQQSPAGEAGPGV